MESLLEHLIGSDGVEKMEFVEDAMEECLAVDGDVCVGGVGEYGCDLVSGWGEGYLWFMLKMTIPRKVYCWMRWGSSVRGWLSRSRI